MKKWLSRILRGFLLLLCVTTAILWGFSYHRLLRLSHMDSQIEWALSLSRGRISAARFEPLAGRFTDPPGFTLVMKQPITMLPTQLPPSDRSIGLEFLGVSIVAGTLNMPAAGHVVAIYRVHQVLIPCWLIILVSGLSLGLMLWIHCKPRRIPAGAQPCPNCGYDLRATPQRCPECGKLAAQKMF